METGRAAREPAGRPRPDPPSILRATNRIVRWAMGVLVVVLLVLAGVLGHLQFKATRDAAEIQAHRTAHVVATQYSWVFQAAAQALRRIAEAAATRGEADLEPHDINEAVRDLPAGLQHSLYDAQGRLILTSVPDAEAVVNISDRSYFHEVRNGAWFVISPMVTERLTGDEVFILARRTGVAGTFTGVATIAIPVASIAEVARALDLENVSTVSLVRSDGMLIARYPPVEPMDLSGSRLFREYALAPNGSYHSSASPADGVTRVVGYWKLDDWPVIAIASLSEEAVFREFWDRARAELAVFMPLVVGLFAMLVWLWGLQSRGEARERDLIAANERADFLMKEIHHRVKNNLQTVMSLVRLEHLPDGAKTALLGRVSAMAAVHQEIYSVGEHDTIPARRYLTGVVENVARSHPAEVALSTEIDDIRLPGDRAMQLGMLVNEVAANAYKHAFRHAGQGKLEVRLKVTEPGWLQLCICDDGPGFEPDETDTNMGTRLIEAFAGQLGGRISRENRGGACLVVDFPRDFSAAAAPA